MCSTKKRWGLIVVVLAMTFCSRSGVSRELPLGLVINVDDSHYVAGSGSAHMNLASLRLFVDQFADTQVSQLFLCGNAQRTNYDSNVWEAIWEGNEHLDNSWFANALILHSADINPYIVWIDRCREKGISPWMSMRMNDIHYASNQHHPYHSTFYIDHYSPTYWTVSTPSELNYELELIRDYFWLLVEEYFEMYDVDGIEFDWLRFSHNVPHGTSCSYITQYMRDIRELADQWELKRGHPILIAARVPAIPEHGKEWGIDGAAWVREGLVDVLTPSPRSFTDFDIPVERWRELIGDVPHKYSLAAGAETYIRVDWDYGTGVPIRDEALMRGFAAAHLYRGADQIYIFNYTYGGKQGGPLGGYQGDPYWAILDQAGQLDTCVNLSRRIPITTHDMKLHQSQLYDATTPKTLDIYIGPKPTTGDVTVRIGVNDASGAPLGVTVNGNSCGKIPDLSISGSRDFGYALTKRVEQFDVPLSAMQNGYNAIHVTGGDADEKLTWAEFYIAP